MHISKRENYYIPNAKVNFASLKLSKIMILGPGLTEFST